MVSSIPKFCMSNPANSFQLLLSCYQSCCTEGFLRNCTISFLLYFHVFSFPLFSPFSLPSVWKIHPVRCVIRLSSLPKSLQLCPIDTLCCLGGLEISNKGEMTLLLVLMTTVSALSPPCPGEPWGCGEAAQAGWTQHGAFLFQLSWSHGTAHLYAPWSSAPCVGAGGSSLDRTMFWGMHRCKGQMALHGTASSCCCLHPCPCNMSFSLTTVGMPSSQCHLSHLCC